MRGDWSDPEQEIVEMPTLRELSNEGFHALRCYTSSPQCVPARFSWLTGLQPSQLGITRNEHVDLPEEAPSIIRWAKQKGWHTELVGKTHWTSHEKGRDLDDNKKLLIKLGFNHAVEIAGPRALQHVSCELTNEWKKNNVYQKYLIDMKQRYGGGRQKNAWQVRPTALPKELYPDVWIADKAVERIKLLPTGKRWIIWVSFVGPHEPFDTPEPWHGSHKDSNLPRAMKTPRWIKKLDEKCELKRQWAGWAGKLGDSEIQELRKDYADHLKLLDDQLKKLLDACNYRSDAGNIGIMVASDHGEMLGDIDMLYKSTLLEPAVRVPFIYREPGGERVRVKYKKEIPLTEAFQKTIYNIIKGGKVNNLRKTVARENRMVVSEFGDEKVFIMNKRKICLDSNGRLLWATKVSESGCREINHSRRKVKTSKAWEKLLNEAQKYIEKTKKREWVWRDLRIN